MGDEVVKAISRLRRALGVQRVAVMPDVHLAEDVCVGVAVATADLLYPQAVGGDIGCGMLAVPFEIEAALIAEPRIAGRIFAGLGDLIPARRRNRRRTIPMPDDPSRPALSDSRLESLWTTEAELSSAGIRELIRCEAGEQVPVPCERRSICL